MADPTSDSMLEDLVGLRVIEGVLEEWVEGHPGDDREFSTRDGDLDEDDDDSEDYDEDSETRVLFVRVDGVEHALFDRGSPGNPRVGASRWGVAAWPFGPADPRTWDPSDPQDARRSPGVLADAIAGSTMPVVCNLFWRPDSGLPCPHLSGTIEGRLVPDECADRVLVAVDEARGLVVLEVGVERYEYQQQRADRVVVPMSVPDRIAPGRLVTIASRVSEAPIRPSRIIIGRNPDAWLVEDIRVGGLSQLVIGGLPGGVFSSGSIDSFYSMSVIEPGAILEFVVGYVGADPLGEPFVASVLGESLHQVTVVGRRFLCRWTPEGRLESWMVGCPSPDPVADGAPDEAGDQADRCMTTPVPRG